MNTCSYIKNAKNDVSMDVLFELSEFFKFFGDTTRIRIIHLLLFEPGTVRGESPVAHSAYGELGEAASRRSQDVLFAGR